MSGHLVSESSGEAEAFSGSFGSHAGLWSDSGAAEDLESWVRVSGSEVRAPAEDLDVEGDVGDEEDGDGARSGAFERAGRVVP